jgi:glycine cleavage system H protein
MDMGNGTYRIGLSDYAQESLGDIVFVELPAAGDALTKDVSLGEVESVKAVSEVLSPVSGSVCAVNDELSAAPETIKDASGFAELLDAEAYRAVCEQA